MLRPAHRHSLRTKLTAIIVLVALSSVALGALVIILDDVSRFHNELSERAALIATTVGDYSATDIAFGDTEAAAKTLAKLQNIPIVLNAHLYKPNGTWFASYKSNSGPPPGPLDNITDLFFESREKELVVTSPITFKGELYGYIQLNVTMQHLSKRIYTRVAEVLSLAVVLIFIAYLLARWAQHIVSKPILALANTAETIASEPNYTLRVAVSSSDEIGILYTSFNTMLERIDHRETERNLAQQALSESEARFAAMFNAIPDAIIFTDLNQHIILTNPGARTMFGYSDKELLGQTTEMLYADPQDYKEQEQKRYLANNGVESAPYQAHYKRKDSCIFWVEAVGCQVNDDYGNHIGLLSVIRDISERKEAEEKIRQLNTKLEQRVQERTAQLETANKELEAFSYSVSHDLRAPLRAIDGFSLAILEDYAEALDDQGKNYIHRVRSATQRMGLLIDDLLALSRVARHEIKVQEVDLSQIANEVAQDLKNGNHARNVEFVIAPNVKVRCDARLLRIVMENLLGNAWKYTSKHPSSLIEFGVVKIKNEPSYFIRDNGAGFDMRYVNKLFGAFQRLHLSEEFPGTGIGLATVARIIHRHGGNVWAEGEIEKGATFYFNLPSKPNAKSLPHANE